MFDLKNMCAHICLLSCYVSKINSQNNFDFGDHLHEHVH